MRKIPTLFLRDKANPKRVTREVDPECQWVIDGKGRATEKFDGSACLILDGVLYKRHQHDAQKGEPPHGWIHHSGEGRSGHGWLPCLPSDSSSRYHLEAMYGAVKRLAGPLIRGTFELVGPKVNGNPHGLTKHQLWQHGIVLETDPPRDFDGIAKWLADARPIEGIVWHHADGRMAKIKRRDFGLPWPVKR